MNALSTRLRAVGEQDDGEGASGAQIALECRTAGRDSVRAGASSRLPSVLGTLRKACANPCRSIGIRDVAGGAVIPTLFIGTIGSSARLNAPARGAATAARRGAARRMHLD